MVVVSDEAESVVVFDQVLGEQILGF